MKTQQSRVGRGTVQLAELLDVAIEHAYDGIAVMKFTGASDVPIRIVYANAAIERLSGYSREELLSPENPFLQIQPQNRARYDALLQEIRIGKSVRFEIELGGKDRSTWTEIRWSPLRYKGGLVTHYVAVLRDITERRRAQAERDLLYRAIEEVHDGFCIVELSDGDARRRRVTYANDAICHMMKLPRERILADGLAGPIFAAAPDLLEQYVSEVSSGVTFERDVLARRGDGATRWIHVTASPIHGDSGKLDRLAITYRDVHDRRENDEQLGLFRSILSQASDFILTTDGKRPSEGGPTITYANPAFYALVGGEPQQVNGRPLVEFFSPRNDKRLLPNVISRLESQQSVSHEVLVHRANGLNDAWIELSGHRVRDEGGRTTSWFFLGKDISVSKRSYMQTAQLTTALDLAEEPITIYDVIKPRELKIQHMNERASELDQPTLEKMLVDPYQRGRIENAWPALESGNTVNRLVYVGDSDPRRWVTLEIRPMRSGRHSIASLIAIEHGLQLTSRDGLVNEVGTALALAQEILGYSRRATRRDACLEALRNEWGAKGSFCPTDGDVDLVIRAKERNGYAIMPCGVLFERRAAVHFEWSDIISPSRLTSLRIFLETLARTE